MNLFYLANYNRLSKEDTNYLLNIFFNGNQSLQRIAWDVILYDNRLLDNSIDSLIMEKVVRMIDLESLWRLAGLNKKYKISRIAFNYLMEIIDETQVLENRRLIKVLNGKMPF